MKNLIQMIVKNVSFGTIQFYTPKSFEIWGWDFSPIQDRVLEPSEMGEVEKIFDELIKAGFQFIDNEQF